MAKHQAGAGSAGTDVGGQDARAKPQDIDTAIEVVVIVDDVLPVTEVEQVQIGALAAVEHVITLATGQLIIACVAVQGVVTRAAIENIVT
ncbi:hypothetical protein D3C84_1017020 [compost metagenome]